MKRRRGVAGTVVLTIIGVVVAGVVLAPVMGVGRCVDSAVPGGSFCESSWFSVIGVPADIWLWAAVTLAIVAAGAVAIVRASRRRGGTAHR